MSEHRYSIVLYEDGASGASSEIKARVQISDEGVIAEGSEEHNWKVELMGPKSWEPTLTIYERGPVPTDYLDFASTILSSVRWANQQNED